MGRFFVVRVVKQAQGIVLQLVVVVVVLWFLFNFGVIVVFIVVVVVVNVDPTRTCNKSISGDF